MEISDLRLLSAVNFSLVIKSEALKCLLGAVVLTNISACVTTEELNHYNTYAGTQQKSLPEKGSSKINSQSNSLEDAIPTDIRLPLQQNSTTAPLTQNKKIISSLTGRSKTRQFGLLIGHSDSPRKLKKAWKTLRQKHAQLLKGSDAVINQEGEQPEAYFSLKIGPYAGFLAAREVCNSLQYKGVNCMLSNYRGEQLD